MMAPSRELPIIERARASGDRVALDAPDGVWTYDALVSASAAVSAMLREGRPDLEEARVAYMIESGGGHVAALLGIWRAGGIAVPLAISHPPAELEHVITDSGATTIIVDAVHRGKIEPLAQRHGIRVAPAPVHTSPVTEASAANTRYVDDTRRALIVYTSGTTGRPKGVVHTHGSVRAQVEMLVNAWGWTDDDRTLLVLPLHHVHGLINVVTCAVWSGARCDVLPRFDVDATWSRIEQGLLTVFMAVPTIYARLIASWDDAPDDRRARMAASCRGMRLMVSGSAALPVPTLDRWHAISGHVLLERYGMTELGMALSNPLRGERRAGHVGEPLPTVDVRLVDEDGETVPPGTPGEIQVRGPAVFLEYWCRPEETRAAFLAGWFRTGDLAVVDNGAYRILGRQSVDILKTGGYKVSALEIEDVLRSHPAVDDCAVVGLPDPEWGERIAAAVVRRSGEDIDPEGVRAWARERLAPYKIPSLVYAVQALPRNALGKVTKPTVRDLLRAAAESA